MVPEAGIDRRNRYTKLPLPAALTDEFACTCPLPKGCLEVCHNAANNTVFVTYGSARLFGSRLWHSRQLQRGVLLTSRAYRHKAMRNGSRPCLA